MTIEELKEELKETIKNLTDWDVIDVWNTYCRKNNYYEDEIFAMAELDEQNLMILQEICPLLKY